MTNPWSAAMTKWLHPMRTSRYLFSETFSPWMQGIEVLVHAIEKGRCPLPEDHPLLEIERHVIARAAEALETGRQARDAMLEGAFTALYGE